MTQRYIHSRTVLFSGVNGASQHDVNKAHNCNTGAALCRARQGGAQSESLRFLDGESANIGQACRSGQASMGGNMASGACDRRWRSVCFSAYYAYFSCNDCRDFRNRHRTVG